MASHLHPLSARRFVGPAWAAGWACFLLVSSIHTPGYAAAEESAAFLVGHSYPVAYRTAGGQLCVIWRGRQRLVSGQPGVWFFEWAPDGSRLLFAAADGLHLVRPDGSYARQVTGALSGDLARVLWSPTATRLAYAVRVNGRVQLWESLANAGPPRQVAPHVNPDAVTWRGDGQALIFATPEEPHVLLAAHVPQGEPEVLVSLGDAALEVKAAPFAADNRLAYRTTEGRLYSIFGHRTRLLSGDLRVELFEWSPDGLYMAFATADAVFFTRPDGADLRRLSDELAGRPSRLVWSPGSSRLAFPVQADGQSELWECLSASGAARKVADTVNPNTVAWRADGQLLVFAELGRPSVLLGAPMPDGEPVQVLWLAGQAMDVEEVKLAPAI